MSDVRRDVPDRYPEDRGCDLHDFCLSCPRETCRYDRVGDVIRRPITKDRDQRIRDLYESGLTYKEIQAQEGVATHTVRRALKRTKHAKRILPASNQPK